MKTLNGFYPKKGLEKHLDFFDRLELRQKKALVTLMSRIAESSYRRGIQQGIVLYLRYGHETKDKDIDLHNYYYRYTKSLDLSPTYRPKPTKHASMKSIDRLRWEYQIDINSLNLK